MFAARAALAAMLDRDRRPARAVASGAINLNEEQRDEIIDAVLLASVAAGVELCWKRAVIGQHFYFGSTSRWFHPRIWAIAEWLAAHARVGVITYAWAAFNNYSGECWLVIEHTFNPAAAACDLDYCDCIGNIFSDGLYLNQPMINPFHTPRLHLADGGARWSPAVHGAYPRERRARLFLLLMLLRTAGLGWPVLSVLLEAAAARLGE